MPAKHKIVGAAMSLLVALAHPAFGQPDSERMQQGAGAVLVSMIDHVEVQLIEPVPPVLLVDARGMVNTTGWSNGRLVPRLYVTPPADGIWDFDFVATPPAPHQVVLQVQTPIQAEQFQWPDPPAGVAGVRVHAATNSMEATIGQAEIQSSDLPPPLLVAAVSVPSVTIDMMPGPGRTTTTAVAVELMIENVSDSPQTLFAPTPCDIFNWSITDLSGGPVQSEPVVICVQSIAVRTLEPGETLPRTQIVDLVKSSYQDGDYRLVGQYWGIHVEAEFSVQIVH